MSTPPKIDAEDLTLYAMQLLPADEMAAIAQYLERSPAARQELARIQGDLAVLALSTAMEAPPAPARARLLKMVAQERKAAAPEAAASPAVAAVVAPAPSFAAVAAATAAVHNSNAVAGVTGNATSNVTPITTYQKEVEPAKADVPEPVRTRFGARVLPWVGWAIAAGLAVTTGDLLRQREAMKHTLTSEAGELATATAEASEVGTARDVLSAMNDQTAKRVTLATKGAPVSPSGRTTYSAEKGVLIFTASNMEPVKTFKVYELWLIPSDGKAPMPIGTFSPDAHGSANLISTSLPKGIEAKAFGVTLEDSGGAKTPTLPILMSGA